MGRTLKHAALIVLLGIALGLAGNQVSPRGLPLVTPPKPLPKAEDFLTLARARLLWQSGEAMFLDAREPADYAAGHIPNALNLPAQSFGRSFPKVAPMLTRESRLILYCDGKDCELSHRLQASLRQLGYTNSLLLSNGWTLWREAGLPVQKGSP